MNQPARRVFALSDLHIGGREQPMLGHPDTLVDFLHAVAACAGAGREEIELVIHGDFIDFLAEEPSEAWTPTESGALAKLESVLSGFGAVFDALAKCIGACHRFTLLLGNHDVELAYPRVRERLLARLGTDLHRCLIVQNNECYRVGELLIEHGNRYDDWNAIDHHGLRAIVSRTSRCEQAEADMEICPGSSLVHEVMNPLKQRYHFVDLLKPEDKLVVLLLTTFEPELRRDLPTIFRGATRFIQQVGRRVARTVSGQGPIPGDPRLVSGVQDQGLTRGVEDAFREELTIGSAQEVSGGAEGLRLVFLRKREESLDTCLREGRPLPAGRLRKLQVALAEKLRDDRTFDVRDGSDAYASAAARLIGSTGARVVVMGHTHLARCVEFSSGGTYVNTGTWADLITLGPESLEDSDESRAHLESCLRKLVSDDLSGIRVSRPTYADVTLAADGTVVCDGSPFLREYQRGVGVERRGD